MKTVTYLQNADEIALLKNHGVSEVLLCHKDLSRQGHLETHEFKKLAFEASQAGLEVVAEWDCLLTTESLAQNGALLSEWCADGVPLSAVRVLDMGAVERALDLPLPIQLCLETGHHNQAGLEALVDYVGARLQRVVLSLELPQKVLATYLAFLAQRKIEAEILGLGPLLIFYSPRPLLSAQAFSGEEQARIDYFSKHLSLEAVGASEESPHRGFPLIENKHGTLMYLPKHHCLLEEMAGLKAMGLSYVRLDLRPLKKEQSDLWTEFWPLWKAENYAELLALYPFAHIRGFYSINKSDVLFGKLKNAHLRLGDASKLLGQVVEVKKGHYLAVKLTAIARSLSAQAAPQVIFYHPEGGQVEGPLSGATKASGEMIANFSQEHLIFLPYRKGVAVKSAIYLQ